jgi:hypothetical protein
MRDATPELDMARQEYVRNNPGGRFNGDIAAGRVRKGMSRLQVRVTWGDPDHVTSSVPGSEVWAYEEVEPSRGTSVYNLHFDGELLTLVDVDHAGVQVPTSDGKGAEDRRDRRDAPTQPTKKPGVQW